MADAIETLTNALDAGVPTWGAEAAANLGTFLSGVSGALPAISQGIAGLGAMGFGSGGGGFDSYKGQVPNYVASREQTPLDQQQPAGRRPGSGGITYFTPMQYSKRGSSLEGKVPDYVAPAPTPATPTPATATPATATPTSTTTNSTAATPVQGADMTVPQQTSSAPAWTVNDLQTSIVPLAAEYSTDLGSVLSQFLTSGLSPAKFAEYFRSNYSGAGAQGGAYAAGGGISGLGAKQGTLGSYSDGGQLLQGPGDGVSDDIPATIDGDQPAMLADGEFVVPARIVSELGNGSTAAGSRKLYEMMDRIAATRRKHKDIATDSGADRHLPA